MSAFPPSHLMVRVGGNSDTEHYEQVGARVAERLMAAVYPAKDVLDWGCGCGRVAVHLTDRVNLRGCDIDAEAIAWCDEHIAADRFDVSPLYPPLPYNDGSFDAVLALSVMTHLPRRMQTKWLRDLARVLRPGGVLAASVHGTTAAGSFGVIDMPAIGDHYLNLDLTGVAPDGYYRDVIQTQEYTRMAWSECFDIIEYDEAALELHDLVVCRRKVL